ncbi:MAG: HEAT repeat domain-containing protein [Cyanobacteria bacterium P01_G01_bin.38]
MVPGIALIIGILIGAIIVYLLMQSKLRRSESLRQQKSEQLSQREQELHHNREQFSHLETSHQQKLREEKHQLQERYEQLFADKVERYQDDFEQKMEALEAEYEARMAVFGGFEDFDAGEYEAADVGEPEPGSVNVVNTASMGPGLSVSEVEADLPSSPSAGSGAPDAGSDLGDSTAGEDDFSVQAVMASTAAVAALPLIPDPWDDSPAASAVMPSTEVASIDLASASPPPAAQTTIAQPPSVAPPKAPSGGQRHQPTVDSRREAAIALGQAAAASPKASLQALPRLAKLSKDADPTVRLAAIQSLGKTGSIKAIPLLRQALRDVNGDVVAAANEGLKRFKGVKKKPATTKNLKKKLPKNR